MRALLKISLACLALWLAACQQAGTEPARPVAASMPATAAAPAVAATKPHNFAQWEKDIEAFEAADKASPPPKNAFLFVGSSTIVRWKTLQQDYPGMPIINRGFGGNEVVDSTHFAERMIFPYQPRMLFFRAGGNDLWAGKTPEQVCADFKEFVVTVRGKMPGVPIVYISWSPSVARWREAAEEKRMNALIEAYIRQTPGLTYVETYDLPLGANGRPRPELFVADGLHFSEAGYKLLIERVRPFVPAK